jgi:hypothetical protein
MLIDVTTWIQINTNTNDLKQNFELYRLKSTELICSKLIYNLNKTQIHHLRC